MYTCTNFKHRLFIYVTTLFEVFQAHLKILVVQHLDCKINLMSRCVVRVAILTPELFSSQSGRQREFSMVTIMPLSPGVITPNIHDTRSLTPVNGEDKDFLWLTRKKQLIFIPSHNLQNIAIL